MLDDWNVLDFPENTSSINIPRVRRPANIVIFIVKENNKRPIYVGQTDRLHDRIGDYVTANFKAENDFKVGEAIKYFQEKGYKIIIKYKFPDNSDNRKKENTQIKSFLSQDFRLLSDLKGYKYKKANPEIERNRIQEFCNKIINNV